MEQNEIKWYVVKTISGKEEKVKTYIEKELEHQKMDKYVSSILIPTEKIFQIKGFLESLLKQQIIMTLVL